MELSKDEITKLMKSNGCCSKHEEKGDYLCSQCKVILCVECKMRHKKDHQIINFKEESFLYEIQLAKEAKKINSGIQENIEVAEDVFNVVVGKMKALIKQLEQGLLNALSKFKKQYLTKAQDQISKKTYKQLLDKTLIGIPELKKDKNYLEIYLNCLQVKQAKVLLSSLQKGQAKHIPFEDLSYELEKVKDKFLAELPNINNYLKRVNKYTPPSFLTTEEIQNKNMTPESPIASRKSQIQSPSRTGPVSEFKDAEYITVLRPYAKETIYLCTGKNEDEIVASLKNVVPNKHKAICIEYFSFVGDRTANAIAEILLFNHSITGLCLCGELISDKGAEEIAKALEHNNSIMAFHLFANNMTDNGAKIIAKVGRKPSLVYFSVGGYKITAECTKAITQIVKDNKNLSAYHLQCNLMEDESAITISNMVKENDNMTIFSVAGTELSDIGVIAVSNAIKTNKKVSAFYLWGNKITAKGISMMAEAMIENGNITTFYLGGFNISDECMRLISEAVKKCPKLNSIYVKGARITSKGLTYISSAVCDNKSVKSIVFYLDEANEKELNLALLMLRVNGSNLSLRFCCNQNLVKMCKQVFESNRQFFNQLFHSTQQVSVLFLREIMIGIT